MSVGAHPTGPKMVNGLTKRVWRWRYTATDGKRLETRWHMSEEQAAHYKDAEKIEGTLEIRTPTGSISDFRKSQPK